jgi:hypothetical protein
MHQNFDLAYIAHRNLCPELKVGRITPIHLVPPNFYVPHAATSAMLESAHRPQGISFQLY